MAKDPEQSTHRRVLDAAVSSLISFGSRHTSVAAIARRAGVSHMTVYRIWPRKDELLSAALEYEANSAFARVDAILEDIDDPAERLIEGFVEIFYSLYTHPLLLAEFERNPDVVLRGLTVASEPTFSRSVEYLAGHAMRTAPLEPGDARLFAEMLVRITHSLLLTSLSTRPFQDRDEVRNWAENGLTALLHLPPGVVELLEHRP